MLLDYFIVLIFVLSDLFLRPDRSPRLFTLVSNLNDSTIQPISGEWRQVVTRLGRWIDFDNDYKTLYPWFMESVWWVFKELYSKGLVYKGYKVMPFSTACSTPLSNFESGQNYKDVVDPTVVVRFPLLDAGDEGKRKRVWRVM